MSIVQDWQKQTLLRDLADFSGDLVESFSRFLLANEKGDTFDTICTQVQSLFTNLANPSNSFWVVEPDAVALEFSQSGEAAERIWSGFASRVSENGQLKDLCKRLADRAEDIRQAQNAEEVRPHIAIFREAFYQIQCQCLQELSTDERVYQ